MNLIALLSNNSDATDVSFLGAVCAQLKRHGLETVALSPRYLPHSSDMRVLYSMPSSKRSARYRLSPAEMALARRGAGIYNVQWTDDDLEACAARLYDLLAELKPAALVVWNNVWPEHSIAMAVASDLRIPRMVLERTPWPGLISLDQRGFISDSLYSNAIRRFASEPFASRPAFAADLFAAIRDGSITWWPTRRGGSPPAVRHRVKRILFLEQLNHDANARWWGGQYQDNGRAMQQLAEACALLPDVELLIRGHPKSHRRVEDLLAELPNTVAAPNGDVIHAIRSCDVVVAVNSAALYEAVIHGKAAIALGTTLLDGLDIFFDGSGIALSETVATALLATEGDLAERRNRMESIVDSLVSSGSLFPCRPPWTDRGSAALAEKISSLASTSTAKRGVSVAVWLLMARARAMARTVRGRLRDGCEAT